MINLKSRANVPAKMKFVLLLLWFKALDVSALYEGNRTNQSNHYSDSGCREFNSGLNDDFFDALRKVESDGDLCKVSVEVSVNVSSNSTSNSTELGPYQISEEYYNEAVEFDPRLKTGGN